jgi:hypothetical protein
MRWAQEKEAEVRAHERKLQLDLQVGQSIPVGSPRGRWELDVCPPDYYPGEGAFDVLFLVEPSESDMGEYGEPRSFSKLIFGPNDESIHGEVMLSTDVSNSTLLNNDFEDTGFSNRMTFLGDGIIRATISTARTKEYAGSTDTINFVGIWYDLQTSKDEAAEKRPREQELDYKYESHLSKADGLKH